MPVRLRQTAEPLSFAARTDTPPHPGGQPLPQAIMARCTASDILEHELGRYCDGLVRGRSFLIAGHRGSGKTTLVDGVMLEFQKRALMGEVRFKPLPVYVHGPLILSNEKKTDPPAAAATALPAAGLLAAGLPAAATEDAEQESDIELRVLLQVAQGLHQAVAKEYAERFHHLARVALAQNADGAGDIAELAARFQIELPEAPAPSRLQEFWSRCRLQETGILFNAGHMRGDQQGLREMVALSGVSHVYQRISGKLQETDALKMGGIRTLVRDRTSEAKGAELVKPIVTLLSAGAVGGATALQGHPVAGLMVAAVTALGAGLTFKLTATTTVTRERHLDRTFLPDLSTKTLHRVMPELFERLLTAGLAPVFIVDELDKVDDLFNRIHQLLDNMKKLFAERAFTCLLVDRGFYEQLHWREELERSPRTSPQIKPIGG